MGLTFIYTTHENLLKFLAGEIFISHYIYIQASFVFFKIYKTVPYSRTHGTPTA